jgi:short-subunit dehydrogenase
MNAKGPSQPAPAFRPASHSSHSAFAECYGPWALVAGASEGLGASYARALADKGLNLMLVARRRQLLDGLAEHLTARSGVETRCLDGDLSDPRFLDALLQACAPLDVGLLVYNAAFAPIGEFASLPLEELLQVDAVNIRAPLTLVRGLLPAMLQRCHGGVILMTSLAGNQGSPYIATYAASKAFNRVLAEALWYELKDKGVDVLACAAGAVRTPGYSGASEGKDAPGTLDAEEVVAQALAALGHGPVVIPGRVNRMASAVMTRVLPKRRAIKIMATNTADVLPAASNDRSANEDGPLAAPPSPRPSRPSPAGSPAGRSSEHPDQPPLPKDSP